MRTRRLTTAYAAGLAAVVALAGCGNGGEGTAAPASPGVATGGSASTASVTAAPSATTTVAEDPVLARIPAQARPETMQGAEAFAKFFVESLNMSSRAADPNIIEGLFISECKTCAAMHTSIEELQAKGRHHAGDTLTVRRTSAISFTEAKRTVQIDVAQKAVPILDVTGKKVGITQSGSGAFAMTLTHRDGRWVVTRLQTVAP